MGLQATSPPTSPLHRPPPINTAPMLKRKHDLVEDDDEDVLMSVTTGASGVKKICVEVVCGAASRNANEHQNDNRHNNSDEDIEDFSDSDNSSSSSDDESKSSSMLEDSIMVTSSNESLEDNKENQVNVNKLNNKELDSILAKTLLNQPSTSAATSVVTSGHVTAGSTAEMPKNDNDNNCPRVIVEHKPLPSIYDLQQMSAACDNLEDDNSLNLASSTTANSNNNSQLKENDSGVSDDDEEDEVSDDLDESGDEEDEECEDDEDQPSPSPIFDPVLRGTTAKSLLPSPPKAIYSQDQRSFWSQNSGNFSSNQSPQPQQQPQVHNGQQSNTFQFLEQTTQRIECAENGKSYLQLGTMNAQTHHLPVTPMIQPKPNMVYRRPIPPFRSNHLVSSISSNVIQQGAPASQPRPVCDHSNCLQKKNSFCYQSQRSRMLNMSLSKLHMARQSHDGSLRRSVLICNMLRYIEDETDRESMNAEAVAVAAAAQQQNTYMETDQHHYWPPVTSQPQNQMSQQPPVQVTCGPAQTVTAESPMYSMAQSQQQAQAQQQAQGPNSLSSPASFGTSNAGPQPVSQEYETTLKDFNSAFRSTPYASPAHPGSDMDSGLGLGDSTSSMDIERGINWSSVLSLSSQSELDPLNNNTFATEAWPSTANTPTTLSSVQGTTLTDISSSTVSVTSSGLTQLTQVTCVTSTNTTTVNGTSFDDIGWKLSADDVLKAFPNDENLFGAVTGP